MKSVVSLVRCPNYDLEEVLEGLRKTFSHFGGIQQWIRPGQRVLLKPNLIIAMNREDCATTDPAVLEALILLVREQEAHVFVGDSPAFGTVRGVAQRCGVAKVCQKHNVPIVAFKKNIRATPLDPLTVSSTLREFDIVINVPKLKAHVQLRLTGAVKNLYGCVSGKLKAWRHFKAHGDVGRFARMLLHTYELVRPAFTVVDAVQALSERGPRGGKPYPLGLLVGGVDCVAMDRVLTEVVDIAWQRNPVLVEAAQLGYSGTDWNSVEIVGERLKDVRVCDFKVPEELYAISFEPLRLVQSVARHLWTMWVRERLEH